MTIESTLSWGNTVAETATGDFADFYRSSYSLVTAQLYALTGSTAEAEEVAQESFMRAWSRWATISGYDSPAAWVIKVGTRLAVSRWRHARSGLKAIVRHGPDESAPEPGPYSVAVVAALKQLPMAQRRALVLHHMGGMSVAEVAALEEVPEGTVKARLSRGRTALAPLLADEASTPTKSPEVLGDA
ncbi:MAG: hypothetical protein QOG53_145 [Frankiales bacterium]|nr:hypothetical protein [Frankiales bacterium]